VLPAAEVEHLERLVERGHATSFEIQQENGLVCVVVDEFRLPAGLAQETTTLLLRLPPGFPDAPPDMFWVDPPVTFAGGAALPASDLIENYLGRQWQRFSRHLAAGEWRPGIDSLGTFLALIRKTLTVDTHV
jgi:hypothetical protein